MYVIVAGGGVVGFYTTDSLSKAGHDVVVIEEKKERALELSEKLDATVIKGSAEEIKTLKEAEVENCDVLLALTGRDESNILICLLAKQLGAKRTICRITHVEYDASIFRKLGIDSVVYPEMLTSTQIQEMVRNRRIKGFAMLEGGAIEVAEFLVGDDSRFVGKKATDAKMPKRSKVVAVMRGQQQMQPDTVISQGDKIVVLTNKDEIKEVEEKLGG